jgi:hypothetical protein
MDAAATIEVMLKLRDNESGLIPLLICVLAIVVGLIVLAYLRVQSHN